MAGGVLEQSGPHLASAAYDAGQCTLLPHLPSPVPCPLPYWSSQVLTWLLLPMMQVSAPTPMQYACQFTLFTPHPASTAPEPIYTVVCSVLQ